MHLPTTHVMLWLGCGEGDEDSCCSMCCCTLDGPGCCRSDTVALTSKQITKICDTTLIYCRSTDHSKAEHPRFASACLILEHGPESLLSQWNLTSLAGCIKLHARGKQKISYDISRFSLIPHGPSISVD